MAKSHHEEGHHDELKNPEVEYEVRDTDIKSVYYIAILFLVFAAIGPPILYGFWWMFDTFSHKTTSQEPRTSRDPKEMRRLDTEPFLQGVERKGVRDARLNPDEDMKIWQYKEDKYLNSYGPAKQGNGNFHIPIEKAMEKALEKGFPVKVATVGVPVVDGSSVPPALAPPPGSVPLTPPAESAQPTPAPASQTAKPTTPAPPPPAPASKPATGH